MPLISLAFVLALAVSGQAPSSTECGDWAGCREAAVAAEAQEDFERFHDLAWRAVQKGPRNDPALMSMLARAQSASGRPLDAVVMLKRIAALGFAPDLSGDAFARVRALPSWPELERELTAAGEAPAPTPAPSVPQPETLVPAPDHAPVPAAKLAAPRVEAKAAVEPAPRTAEASETLTFTHPAFSPAGLAYDGVSRRFIVGDRRARKLTVVDEFSHQIATLAGSLAGFGEIAALEIDPRAGDLWVVTADDSAAAAGETTLHKLQLISARALSAFSLPGDAGPGRLTDVAVTAQGMVLTLDSAGGRVFRLRPGGKRLERVAEVGAIGPLSLAPAPADVVYVGGERGLERVELEGGSVSAVEMVSGEPIEGMARIRWHGRSLVGIQRVADGGHRAVRLMLSRNGRKVASVEVLDPAVEASPSAACISGDSLYYLAPGSGGRVVVRRVPLK